MPQLYGIVINNSSDFSLKKLINLVYNICRSGVYYRHNSLFFHRNTMDCKRRLLILSCSQRKHTSEDLLPAIERYNGPLFWVLRRFLRECPREAKQLDIHILSAAYGLISADFPTPFYNQKMNMSRVVELQPEVNTAFSNIFRNNYASICFVLGKTYLKVFDGLQHIIPSSTESIVTHGPIGKKQVQLKRWLWETL